jgi:hypothetical protein
VRSGGSSAPCTGHSRLRRSRHHDGFAQSRRGSPGSRARGYHIRGWHPAGLTLTHASGDRLERFRRLGSLSLAKGLRP